MDVWIALYKGKGNFINSIVRRWTKSQYSHAELILEDKVTWIGISPFIKSQVTDRKNVEYNPEKWDFYKMRLKTLETNSVSLLQMALMPVMLTVMWILVAISLCFGIWYYTRRSTQ